MSDSLPYAENFTKALNNGDREIQMALLGWSFHELEEFRYNLVNYFDIAREVIKLAMSNKVDFQCDKPKPESPDVILLARPVNPYLALYSIKLREAWFDAHSGETRFKKKDAA